MREREEWRAWPNSIRTGLEQASKAGVAQEMLRTHHLTRILEEFDRTGVRCLLMKGEALALSHYATPGTRARCDSDLFIRIKDIARTKAAMRDIGFMITSPIYKSHQFTVMPSGDRSGLIHFDVHWRILNHPRYARILNFMETFAGAVDVPGLDNVRVPGVVDALLLACMHRFGSESHDRNRLIWIYDVHLMVTAMTQLELTEFATKALERGVQAICLDGLNQSQVCFKTDVSPGVKRQLESPDRPQSFPRRYSESHLSLLIDDLKALPDWNSRLALLGELFLPSPDFLMMRYGRVNRFWLPLLYLRQVFGGIVKRLSLR